MEADPLAAAKQQALRLAETLAGEAPQVQTAMPGDGLAPQGALQVATGPQADGGEAPQDGWSAPVPAAAAGAPLPAPAKEN